MRHQRLRSVVVEGLTSIRSAALELNDVNVLVGANGAGKSNLIRALGMLGRIVDGELGLYVGLSGGASALLNADPTEPRRIRLQVGSDAGGYSAELIPAAGDTLIFSDEAVLVRNTGVLTSLGRGHRETALTSTEPLWVLADCNRLGEVMGDPGPAAELGRVVRLESSPELVNDGIDTAPSKRIKKAYPQYEKTLHGPWSSLTLASTRSGAPPARRRLAPQA